MTHIEDIHDGDWVAVTSVLGSIVHPLVTGLPLKVITRSLPFIVVSNSNTTIPLDVRVTEFQKLEEAYVTSYCLREVTRKINDIYQETPTPQKQKSTLGHCPRCEAKMIEELREGVWYLVCRECSFSGSIKN